MPPIVDRTALIKKFKSEIDERLDNLNRGLLALEQNASDTVTLNDIFREAHTIKGAARMLDLGEIQRLAHGMEDLLDVLRQRPTVHSRDMTDLLLKCSDRIAQLMDQAAGGSVPEGPDGTVESLCRTLDELIAASSDREAAEEGPPATATLEAERPSAPPSDGLARDEKPPGSPEESPGKTKQEESPGPAWSVSGVAEIAALKPPVLHPIAGRTDKDTLRVATEKLDRLVNLSCELTTQGIKAGHLLGELKNLRRLARDLEVPAQGSGNGVVAGDVDLSSLLQNIENVADLVFREYSAHTRQLRFLIGEISRVVGETRMLPIQELFTGVHRTVRDLCRESGKVVDLTLHGEDTQVDKKVTDELRGALAHIVRNSVDHGIEDVETRRQRGKPEAGQVTLKAFYRGDFAVIEVEDDGKGIDPAQIKQVAIRKGVIDVGTADTMSDEEALYLIFSPGFTSSTLITDVSGRGVGLDVVKTAVERLDGRVTVESERGRWSRFTICVPLVLSTTRAFIVLAGGEYFAIPTTTVEKTVSLEPGEVDTIGSARVVLIDDAVVRLASLAGVLGLKATGAPDNGGRILAVVLSHAGQRVAFSVDQIMAEETIVVSSLGAYFRGVRTISGATLLGGGEVAVIINAGELLRAVGRERSRPRREVAPSRRDASVLLVDDSMNIRELLKSVIESAGHQVEVASNGLEGLDKARSKSFDIVVTDVEMPEMNGFELTRALRMNEQYANKPIVIVTTLETPQDRRKGLEAGANAYLVKGSLDHKNLLDTIESLIG